MTRRIALLGFGAIGHDLVRYLAPEFEAGLLALAGVAVRHPDRLEPPPRGAEWLEADGLPGAADLVVECAGVEAARRHGPVVVASGCALLLASVGALADEATAAALMRGPGGLIITSGAVGGLDLIRAAAGAGGLDTATITTTKAPASLVQPWMRADESARLRALREPEVLFEGTPAEAIERFPTNVNVAVALGVAMRGAGSIPDGLARVRVRLVADPHTDASTHVIEAAGSSGRYRFEFGNRPSPANPRSSAITAQALAAEVRAWAGAGATRP